MSRPRQGKLPIYSAVREIINLHHGEGITASTDIVAYSFLFRKVTCFGSARIPAGDPGIMQACNEDATGGFGTMDETYECITLIQTGKSTIFPIVLLDTPEETFWRRWAHFIIKELEDAGLISKEDKYLLHHSTSAEEAYQHIAHFYSRFHSYYYDGPQIIIRINSMLNEDNLDRCRHDFADIIEKHDLAQQESDPADPDPLLGCLPRIRFTFGMRNFARLRQMIDQINDAA